VQSCRSRRAGCWLLRPQSSASTALLAPPALGERRHRRLACINSVLSTRKDNSDRGSLSLRPERRSIVLFKIKGAGWTYGKRIEDALVRLAGDHADLATFSVDEANDRSTWGAGRASWPSWANGSLRCHLVLFAGS